MSASASDISLAGLRRPATDEPVHETIIQASKGWIAVDWAELVRQRELLFFLVWRDIKVRYKQAMLGFAWAVLQPIAQVIIFTAIFGSGLNLASKLGSSLSDAYPLFIFAGLLPWQFFARALNDGGLSLVNQQHLLTKIYFPRLFVPTASIGGGLFDMLVSLPVLAAVMIYFGKAPPAAIVFLPLLVLATAILASGMAYLLSALTVNYRDFRFIIPFMAQLWMWMSFIMIPVPAQWVTSPKWQWLLTLNPMYGLVAAYRRVLLPNFGAEQGWDPKYLWVSLAMTLVIFVLGLFYFRRTERRFADIA